MYKAYVFMGYPGSGKSTIALKMTSHDTDLYLSSDKLREEMFGFRDQTRNQELFEELYKRAIDHAGIGDVYVDATNLSRKDRLKVIDNLHKHYSMNLICVLRPIDEIVDVNNERAVSKPDEFIPDEILKRILGKFQLPVHNEGWDKICFYLNYNNLTYFDYAGRPDMAHNNPHHPETIKEHIDFVNKICIELGKSAQISEIARYHDLGKFFVQTYNEDKGFSQTIGHAAVSAYIYLVDHMFYLYQLQKDTSKSSVIENDDLFTYSFITTFYGIYYHDLPYEIARAYHTNEEIKQALEHSLSKPSKGIRYLYDNFAEKITDDPIEHLAHILLEFNKIDRMREGDNNGDD